MKKIVVILTALLMVTLTGCGESSTPTYTETGAVPILMSNHTGFEYWYVIDKRTHVVYLQFDGNYAAGITVMLNRDGTPVTAEQLQIGVSE